MADLAIPLPTNPPQTSPTIPMPTAPPAVTNEPPDPLSDSALMAVIQQAQLDQKAAATTLATAPEAAPATPETPAKASEQPKPAEIPPKDTTKLQFKPETPPAVPEPEEIAEDARVPQTSAEWKKFRESHNKTKVLLKDRDAKLAEWEKRKVDLEQLETIRAERDAMAAKFKEFTVVNDPALTREYDEAMESSLVAAKANLGDETLADTMAVVAKLPPGKYRQEQLKALLESAEDWQKSLITTHLAEFTSINVRRERKIQAAKANVDQIIQQREAQRHEQARQQDAVYSKMFDAAVSDMKNRPGYKDIFEQQDFAKSWIAAAKQTYQGKGEGEAKLAEKALKAELADPLIQHAITREKDVAERDAKITELESVIARLRGATPSPNTTGFPSQSTSSEDPFLEGLTKAFSL